MRDPFEYLGTVAGLFVAGWLTVAMLSIPQGHGSGPAGPATEMEIALEAPPPPPPPPPPPEPEPEPEPVTEPTPPQPETAPITETPPPEEPEEEFDPESMLDEDGAPITPPKEALVQVSEEAATAYRNCLFDRTYYPSTKAAKKLKPRGVVHLKILIIDKKVAGIEITQSSGSEILDQAARSSVLNSRCERKGELFGIIVAAIRF